MNEARKFDVESWSSPMGTAGTCFVCSTEWGLWIPQSVGIKLEGGFGEVTLPEINGATVIIDRVKEKLCFVSVTLSDDWKLVKL